jgi:hypothetical protein
LIFKALKKSRPKMMSKGHGVSKRVNCHLVMRLLRENSGRIKLWSFTAQLTLSTPNAVDPAKVGSIIGVVLAGKHDVLSSEKIAATVK